MVYMKEIVTLILFNAWICVHGFIPIDSSVHSKLLKIRDLSNSSSSFVGGLKPTQEDPEVCYTQGCLDAGIHQPPVQQNFPSNKLFFVLYSLHCIDCNGTLFLLTYYSTQQ
jgi:hypothetical protein